MRRLGCFFRRLAGPHRLATTAATAVAASLCIAAAGAQPEAGIATQVWIEDPSHAALDHFHAALLRLEAARSGVDSSRATESAERAAASAEPEVPRVRISVWGSALAASDRFTAFLREDLQGRFGDGGPGFVLPASPFSSYAHRQVRIAGGGRWHAVHVHGRQRAPRTYGPMGIALEARRAEGWVEVLGRPVDTVHVHYFRQQIGGYLEVQAGDLRRVIRTRGRGSGTLLLRPDGGVRRVDVRAIGGGPVRVLGLSLERDAAGVIVDAMGIPGSRLRDRLPWNDEALRMQLRQLSPDLIVLAYGTNESGFAGRPIERYRGEADEAVRRARASAPEASCLLVGPADWPERGEDGRWRARERTARVIEIQREIAFRHGCGYFDLVAFQGGPATMPRWVDAGLARPDYVHFTDRGHRILARVLSRALLCGYESGDEQPCGDGRTLR